MSKRALPSCLIAAVLALSAASGCRNPFDPEADVIFDRFFCGATYTYVLLIERVKVTNGVLYGRAEEGKLFVGAQLLNSSSVSATIKSYTVVYKDVYTGAPISSCGGSAGRRFYSSLYLSGLNNNTSAYTTNLLQMKVVTNELLDHIKNNAYTINGGIDCEISFHGVDDNGHDLKIDTTLHIEVYE